MKAWVEGDFSEGDFRVVTPERSSPHITYEIELTEEEIVRFLELQEEWDRMQKKLRDAAMRKGQRG